MLTIKQARYEGQFFFLPPKKHTERNHYLLRGTLELDHDDCLWHTTLNRPQCNQAQILLSPTFHCLNPHKGPNKSALSAADEAEQKRLISHKRLGVGHCWHSLVSPALVWSPWPEGHCHLPRLSIWRSCTSLIFPTCAICLVNVICFVLRFGART